jgi:lipopolysaccharide transport system permease protein
VIEANRRLAPLRARELWAYRELLYFLVWRDLKVRYRQTALGAIWAILQPLLTMVVFTLFFHRLAGIESAGLPYPLFAYTGLLAWTFFAQAVTQAANSLVGSAHLITKVYFPRLLVPLAAIVGAAVDLLVALPVLFIMMAVYRVAPGPALVLLPAVLLVALAAAAGVGVWLAAVNVKYRDVRHAVPFLVQILLFLTPVIYPAATMSSSLARFGVPGWVVALNPMAGAVEGLRWALLGPAPAAAMLVLVGAVVAAVLIVSGLFYFRSVERSFADVV